VAETDMMTPVARFFFGVESASRNVDVSMQLQVGWIFCCSMENMV